MLQFKPSSCTLFLAPAPHWRLDTSRIPFTPCQVSPRFIRSRSARQECQVAEDCQLPVGVVQETESSDRDIRNGQNEKKLKQKLVYDGVIFDMDGTLSVSYIDYVEMRSSIDIPYGDLFTVMETWSDGQRIKAAVEIILDIESKAAEKSHAMPGMYELLEFLRGHDIKIGLVTRNTVNSVDAFFAAIGVEWREAFDIVLTRDNIPFVKPDKRCLLHFAKSWGLEPRSLLMVGDSTEDVECGNAAGTATCLLAGGGNETVMISHRSHPPGAVPSFEVSSLAELRDRLDKRDTCRGWESSSGGPRIPSMAPGSPAPGLDFMDWLFAADALEAASCSFPRIDIAHSSSHTPTDQHPGSKVLHIECGNGALTKHLFSSGLFVVGVDSNSGDIQAASKRGLAAVYVENLLLKAERSPTTLKTALETADLLSHFDAAIHIESGGVSQLRILEDADALAQVWDLLRVGGNLCIRSFQSNSRKEVEERLNRVGFRLVHWEAEEECSLEEDAKKRLHKVIATKAQDISSRPQH